MQIGVNICLYIQKCTSRNYMTSHERQKFTSAISGSAKSAAAVLLKLSSFIAQSVFNASLAPVAKAA